MRKFVATISMLAVCSLAMGDTIYEEDFSASIGGGDGWTLADPDGLLTVESVGDSDGVTHSVLKYDGGNTPAGSSVERTVDTTGYSAINIDLTVFQRGDASYEGDPYYNSDQDWIELFVDYGDGNGFTSVLRDEARWEGVQDDIEGSNVSLPGQGTPLTAEVGLSELADNNSSLGIRITMATNTGSAAGGWEPYYVDNLIVEGVPEPTTMALLGLGGLAVLRRRKK